MLSKSLIDAKRLDAPVTVLLGLFANSIEQTSSRIFYAIAAAENLLVLGADVSNAFGEAPPPKQSFYIKPDKPFRDWYISQDMERIFRTVGLFPYWQLCKATRNHLGYGKNTATRFFVALTSSLPHMNPAFTQGLLTERRCTSNVKLMILQSLVPTKALQRSFTMPLTNNSKYLSSVKVYSPSSMALMFDKANGSLDKQFNHTLPRNWHHTLKLGG
jgi:hypothetical protein